MGLAPHGGRTDPVHASTAGATRSLTVRYRSAGRPRERLTFTALSQMAATSGRRKRTPTAKAAANKSNSPPPRSTRNSAGKGRAKGKGGTSDKSKKAAGGTRSKTSANSASKGQKPEPDQEGGGDMMAMIDLLNAARTWTAKLDAVAATVR